MWLDTVQQLGEAWRSKPSCVCFSRLTHFLSSKAITVVLLRIDPLCRLVTQLSRVIPQWLFCQSSAFIAHCQKPWKSNYCVGKLPGTLCDTWQHCLPKTVGTFGEVVWPMAMIKVIFSFDEIEERVALLDCVILSCLETFCMFCATWSSCGRVQVSYGGQDEDEDEVNTSHSSAIESATLHSSAIESTTLHSSAIDCTTLHSSAVESTTLHSSAVESTTLHSSAVGSTTLHSSAIESTTLHSSAVESATLHSSAMESAYHFPFSRCIAPTHTILVPGKMQIQCNFSLMVKMSGVD